jgi:hypothetical protein
MSTVFFIIEDFWTASITLRDFSPSKPETKGFVSFLITFAKCSI